MKKILIMLSIIYSFAFGNRLSLSEYNLGIDIGAISGDATGEGVLTVNDLIFYIDVILNGND